MANFRDAFTPYLPVDSMRVRIAVTQGMVVLDANVLLDAYRYTAAARRELLENLHALGSRLWIPHQVALEFYRNRANVIASYGDAYSSVGKSIKDFRGQYDILVGQIREFGSRIALTGEDLETLLRPIAKGIEEVQLQVEKAKERHGVSERFLANDPVLADLQALLSDKVGEAMAADDEAAERQTAQDRIERKIAPGFKDAGKSDPCGDYLFWIQSLREVKKRKVPLVIVTRDVKDDWFLRIKGNTVGALPELVAEAKSYAGVDFVAMPTRSFLLRAKAHLNTRVSDSTLKQSEAMTRPRKVSRRPLAISEKNLNLIRAKVDSDLEAVRRGIETTDAMLAELRSRSKSRSKDDDTKLALAVAIHRLNNLRVAEHELLVAKSEFELDGLSVGPAGLRRLLLSQPAYMLAYKVLKENVAGEPVDPESSDEASSAVEPDPR